MISIEQLSFRVDGRTILRRLDMCVQRGEVFAVMGMSGVGKSTLLKCIAGLISPNGGQITIDGTNISRMKESQLRDVRRKIGMVFQYAALFDSLNVYENVIFGLKRHTSMTESELRVAAAEKLALVGLSGTEAMMPSQLSGGMQKRVGLARALALDPSIILYDEPTAGLDPITAAAISELIVRMRDQLRVTSVVVTHDLSLIKQVSNRVGMIHRGKIIEVGTWQELESSDNAIVKQFIGGSTDGPIRL